MKTKLLTLLLCLLTTLPALAAEFEVDGIRYNTTGNNTVAVTRDRSVHSNDFYSGSITIPAEVQYDGKTYSVTSIYRYAFIGSTGLTSVTIPNSVTKIDENAFYGCENLTSMTLPNSITKIGDYAFYRCESLTSVILPNSVTEIGERAFSGTNLTSVTIPNSITKISDGAFSGTNLTSVTIPNSVTSIGDYAFAGTNLTSVTIPNSVTSIGDYAFASCNLTDIYCEAEVPPTSSDVIFNNVDYANCTLYVPTGAVETYRTTDPWSAFSNIVGYDFAGVAEVSSVSPAVAYDLQGRRVSNPRRGIFIVNGRKQRLN